jgi:hypothetical protein
MSGLSNSLVEKLKASLTDSASVATPGTEAYEQGIKRWSDAAEKKAVCLPFCLTLAIVLNLFCFLSSPNAKAV